MDKNHFDNSKIDGYPIFSVSDSVVKVNSAMNFETTNVSYPIVHFLNEEGYILIESDITGNFTLKDSKGNNYQTIQNGAVYVNGELFDEKVDLSAIEEAGLASEELKLEDDEYFVLGDNRNNSEDSRYANIGNVKKDYIIGKAWFRVSPWKKFGFI